MLYGDFLNILNSNNLSLKEIAPILGYSKYSISNNWKKDKNIPKKALISLNLYLELEKEKTKSKILEKKINLQMSKEILDLKKIPEEVLDIAKKKCAKNNISLENYIASLIITNI